MDYDGWLKISSFCRWLLNPKPCNIMQSSNSERRDNLAEHTINCRKTQRAVDWCFNLETNKKGMTEISKHVAVIPSSALIYTKPLPRQSKSLDPRHDLVQKTDSTYEGQSVRILIRFKQPLKTKNINFMVIQMGNYNLWESSANLSNYCFIVHVH